LENQSLLDFSENISADVKALFSLNPLKYSREEIAHNLAINAKNLAVPEQVHSAVVDFARCPGMYPLADGLVTQDPDIILTLKVADCVPIFLHDPSKNIIGLVHSGWRGTVKNIVLNAIQLMEKNGTETGNIRCILGPAIGICCYKVDGEVAKNFDDKVKVKMEERKWRIGLHEQIRLQLASVGVQKKNICSSDICTYESQDYHSYRRDGENAGRMFAFLRLK